MQLAKRDTFGLFSRRRVLALAGGAAVSAAAGQAFADSEDSGDDGENSIPGAVTAPQTRIDLSRWKLTLPVNDKGRVKGGGDAAEVKSLPGFALPPYFVVTPQAVKLMAPVGAVTTSGSHYPRCELRELNAGGDLAEWNVSQGGLLQASLSVDEVPTDTAGHPGRIVIGQIHGPNDELCRLYYDAGVMYFIDDKAGEASKETQFLLRSADNQLTQIPLGAKFSYLIRVSPGNLTVSVSYVGRIYSAHEMIGSFWDSKKLYFKAGVYVQLKTGAGQGAVTLTSLSATH
ncbi:MAG TPA: polysaccharide lyase family 7 protein [Devosiaceae bacterium]|nr:polysaccharide lyase family 7 protein [Devosiaceae bacterium]